MQADKKDKEKKIKYLSYWKTIGLLVIGCLFTLEGLHYGNYFVSIFFGLSTIITIYPFINPKVKIVWIGTKAFKESIAKESSEKMNDTGIFTYNESDFSVKIQSQEEQHNWNDIVCMVAYKRDDFTTDCICLDVFCSNKTQFSINEDTKGWYQFIKRTKEQFPTINKLWDLEITSPAFKKNLTLVYDRENRTLDEVTKTYYLLKIKNQTN